MIEVQDLCKVWPGGTVALNTVSFKAEPGTITAIIGPSGSGKSTLLRVVCGVESYKSGSIVNTQGKVGLVFQDGTLWPHLTLEKNVSLPLQLVEGWTREQAADRARQVLKSWGLGNRVNAYPAELSGGEQRRGALARAWVMEPQVLCLDEVTSGLDPEAVGAIWRAVLDWKEGSKPVILMTTHNLDLAQCADQVLLLDGGRVVEQGTSADFFSAPKEERTKAFLRAGTTLPH
ncbi:MAG: ATP-binding cassette domain-containing protein [Patescibacteria group bacterium]|jgi:ABC-type polar amino acid transport system ATPase subunit